MRQALYRKYRSNSLSDVVGQDSIVKTLTNSIKDSKISHAYLFVGPRGVGKTSVARIFAHQINNLEYKLEDNHLDIIEIDGASNRGIDEIRDLREKSTIAPSYAKYKVYIIDEVHMLTLPAFNALLKLLEEPPAHVIFILATTDVGKVPETIISRTQKFIFKPHEIPTIVSRLNYIAKKEDIVVSEDALSLIAELSEGGLRDAINILDQLSSMSKNIKVNDVSELIGLPSEKEVNFIIDGVLHKTLNTNKVFTKIDELANSGTDIKVLVSSMIKNMKNRLIDDNIEPSEAKIIIKLIWKLLEIGNKPYFKDYLKIILSEELLDIDKPVNQYSDKKIKQIPDMLVKDNSKKDASIVKLDKTVTEKVDIKSVWDQLLKNLKNSHTTLYSTLMMSKVSFIDEDTVEVMFRYKFYSNQLNNSKNFKIISDILTELGASNIKIISSFDKELVLEKNQPEDNDIISDTKATIDTKEVFEVFKGAEFFQGDSEIS